MSWRRDNKDLFTIPEQFTEDQRAAQEADAARKARLKRVLAIASVPAVAVAGAGISYTATQLAGGAAKNRAVSEWEQKMDKASAARRAIAERYAGCVITDVVDTHTSEVRTEQLPDTRGLPSPIERAPRNKVVITVKATKNPASIAAEQAYANGTPDANIVRWHPFSLGAATDIVRKDEETGKYSRIPIPRNSTATEAGPNEEMFTITMYPRTDKRRTTSADVSLLTYAETYDHEKGDGVTYVDTGRMTCGSIREVLMNGLETWQAVPGDVNGVPRFESYHGLCANVPSVDQPGMFTRECS